MLRRPIVALAALMLVNLGCSALLGKPYRARKTLPGSMAMIYIYSGEIDALQNVLIDREPRTPAATHSLTMIKNGYFPYLMPAGPVRILTTAGKEPYCISMETLPGFHYWVRVSGKNADVQRVEVVTPDVGEREISGHREMGTGARDEAKGVFDVPCPENAASGTRIAH